MVSASSGMYRVGCSRGARIGVCLWFGVDLRVVTSNE
jgi:hypothetical protein